MTHCAANPGESFKLELESAFMEIGLFELTSLP
jgi:hypothetical protein